MLDLSLVDDRCNREGFCDGLRLRPLKVEKSSFVMQEREILYLAYKLASFPLLQSEMALTAGWMGQASQAFLSDKIRCSLTSTSFKRLQSESKKPPSSKIDPSSWSL